MEERPLIFGCLRVASAVLLLAVPLIGQEQIPRAQSGSAARWQPTRLADGQPDVQGFWGAVLGGTVSLTNPVTGGGEFQQRITGRAVSNPTDGRLHVTRARRVQNIK